MHLLCEVAEKEMIKGDDKTVFSGIISIVCYWRSFSELSRASETTRKMQCSLSSVKPGLGVASATAICHP